jgi:mannose-1-phosphate guanylyltransferase
MISEGSDAPAPIVNAEAIGGIVATIHQDGDDIVLSEEASKRIADFKHVQKLMGEAEKQLKEHIKEALKPFNSSALKSRYITVSVSKPRAPTAKYEVKRDDKEYQIETTVWVPDNEAIDAYVEAHGTLPEGVAQKPFGDQTVTFRVKQTS